MALELNKIKADLLDHEFDLALRAMDKFYSQYEKYKDDDKVVRRIARSSKNLCYLYYLKEDNTKSIEYIKIAASAQANEFFCQKPPKIVEHTRTPWEYIESIELVSTFGSDEDLSRLLNTDEKKFFYGSEEELNECQFLANVAFGYRQYLGTGTVDNTLLTKLVNSSSGKGLGREEKHFIVPIVNGLKALVEDNKTAWEASIQEALNAHLKEVKSGDYRNDIDGFICMPGMMLIKLGSKKSWQTDIDSLYLPKQLMGQSVEKNTVISGAKTISLPDGNIFVE